MNWTNRWKEIIGSRKQDGIAAEWLDRWKERGGKAFSIDHVASNLSRCVRAKAEGVRFFFQDRSRAALLFDIVELRADARDTLFAEADALLGAAGEHPARVVVDLTRWAGDRDDVERMCVACEETILRIPVGPVVIVITDAQYRWIPRTLDERDDVRLERVPDEQAGEVAARKIAGETALVLSPWKNDPFERWIALEYSKGAFEMDPPDAMEVFSRDGRLEPLPPVKHDVTELGVTPAKKSPLPRSAIARRRLMASLTSASLAAELDKAPGVRLAWATELGIKAAATERELVDADVQRIAGNLGMPLDADQGAQARRDTLLDRATRRSIEPAAFRVGDEVHVVAPVEAVSAELRRNPRVRVHAVELRVPVLRRLREAVAGMTIDDLIEDPYLERVVARLDPDGREKIALAHARAVLLGAGIAPAPSMLVKEWRAPLAAFVANDPPKAELRASLPPRFVPAALHDRCRHDDLWDLGAVPPAGDVLVTRGDALLFIPMPAREGLSHMDTAAAARRAGGEEALAEEKWQDQLEIWLAARARERLPTPRRNSWDPEQPPTDPDARRWEPEAPALPADCWPVGAGPRNTYETRPADQWIVWEALDRWLTTIWFALARASRSRDAVRAPNGDVHVHVGGGVILQLSLRAHGSSTAPIRTAFTTTTTGTDGDPRKWWWSSFHSHTTTTGYHGSIYEPGYELPHRLYLVGAGIAADASFGFAPWMAADPVVERLRQPAHAAITDAEKEEARQASYDDD